MNKLIPSEMIKFGWETFKKRPLILIGIVILMGIVSKITDSISSSAETEGGLLLLVASLVAIGISIFADLGMNAFSLKAHDNIETVSVNDLWRPQVFLNYFAASVITGIAVVIGFVLLIVPGVILALMFAFVKFIVIERGMGPIEAMKESKRITDGHKMDLFVLLLLIIGINILGALALLVGLLVSIPVSALAMVHAYRVLANTAPAAVTTV